MGPLHPDDYALTQGALRADPAATAQLFERLGRLPGVVRARAKRVGQPLRPDEVEETVQNVLVTVWKKLADYDGRAPLEAWAGGIATFAVLKTLDRRQASRDFSELDGGNEPVQRKSEQPDHAVSLANALNSIGPPGDEITRLKHFEDLTFAEIADRLQMPFKTVMSRYYRTLERLRALLGSNPMENPS